MPAPDPGPTYTTDRPCRCGYAGTGIHQCHAGRHPDYPEARCQNPAVARPVATVGSLPGAQMKTPAIFGHYCPQCWIEAGFPAKDAT